MSLTSTHYFCGGGGDTEGLRQAGFTPTIAVNHDKASIATHKANFPDCIHINSNIEQVEPRRLPRTDVLWGSPICTESSPAGGKKRKKNQPSLFEDESPLTDSEWERTRVTALAVIAAAEAHRYDVVMGENVIEFATDWPLFDWWLKGFDILGYDCQLLSLNAAHVGGPGYNPAAQWRNRLFFLFSRKEIKMPKLKVNPPAWCPRCDEIVSAEQAFKKPGQRIGKYREQYVYLCPNGKCGNAVVEPFVRPASSIIDWSHVGTRIGDRKRPLAANTIRRVEAGLAKFANRRVMVTLNHGDHDGRPFLPEEAPFPARTIKIGEGLVTPPMLVPCGGTRNDDPWPVTDPMRTLLTRDAEAVVTPAPWIVKHYAGFADPTRMALGVDEPLGTLTTSNSHGVVMPEAFVAELRRNGTARSVSDPFATFTSGGLHHALVVPYYTKGQANSTDEPLSTVTTIDRHALVTEAVAVDDCHLRMVQPREQFSAQAFPRDYKLVGTKTQQTAQAGNAVPVNIARRMGEHVYAVLDGRRP